MVTERQVKILKILKQHKSGIIADEIAKLCGVSAKTVRTDLKTIMSKLNRKIAEIYISRRIGYSIDIHDMAEFNKIIDVKTTNQIDGKERTKYILCSLIEAAFLGEPLKQQKLADDLYISLSTLKTYFKLILDKKLTCVAVCAKLKPLRVQIFLRRCFFMKDEKRVSELFVELKAQMTNLNELKII